MPSQQRWKKERPETAGAKRRRNKSPSRSRLSRAGARADTFGTCWSRVGRATKIYLCIRRPTEGGGDARAISEGVWCLKVWPADRMASWLVWGLVVWLVDWLVESLKFPSSQTAKSLPQVANFLNGRLRSSALWKSPAPSFEARHVAKLIAKCRNYWKKVAIVWVKNFW